MSQCLVSAYQLAQLIDTLQAPRCLDCTPAGNRNNEGTKTKSGSEILEVREAFLHIRFGGRVQPICESGMNNGCLLRKRGDGKSWSREREDRGFAELGGRVRVSRHLMASKTVCSRIRFARCCQNQIVITFVIITRILPDEVRIEGSNEQKM